MKRLMPDGVVRNEACRWREMLRVTKSKLLIVMALLFAAIVSPFAAEALDTPTEDLYIRGEIEGGGWSNDDNKGKKMTKVGDKFYIDVKFTGSRYFRFAVASVFYDGNQDWGTGNYGAANVQEITPYGAQALKNEDSDNNFRGPDDTVNTFRVVIDFTNEKVSVFPTQLFMTGNIDGITSWTNGHGKEGTLVDDYFVFDNVKIQDVNNGYGYFRMIRSKYDVNNNCIVPDDNDKELQNPVSDQYLYNNNAYSWKIPAGEYNIKVYPLTQTVTFERVLSDMYITGNFGAAWMPDKASKMSRKVNGGNVVYEYCADFSGSNTFAVSTAISEPGTAWAGFNSGRMQLAEGTTLTEGVSAELKAYENNDANIELPSAGYWNIKVTYNGVDETYSIVANKADLYITGTLNGNGWTAQPNTKMTGADGENASWTFTGYFTGDRTFALSTTIGDAWDDWNAMAAGRMKLDGSYYSDNTQHNNVIYAGETKNLVKINTSDDNDKTVNIQLPYGGAWTLTVTKDGDTMKLTAAKPQERLFITGSFGDGWMPNPTAEMTYSEDGDNAYYTFTTTFYGENTFALSSWCGANSSDWDAFDAGRLQLADGILLTANTTTNLTAYDKKSTHIKLPEGGVWTITVAYDKTNHSFYTIKAVPFSRNLYITGNFGEYVWSPCYASPMDYDLEKDVYTYIADFSGDCNFALSTTLGNNGDDWGGFAAGRFELDAANNNLASVVFTPIKPIGDDTSVNIHIGKSGLWKITVKGDMSEVKAEPIEVNMPLKRADFAGGKAHYFLVGSRQGDWHLQPEWEFEEQTDGTYKLPGRFMYTGIIGVGRVKSYDDYVSQRFELFVKPGTKFGKTAKQTWEDAKMSEDQLASQGKKQGYVRYEGVKFDKDNVMVFYADHSTESTGEVARNSKSIYVGATTLTLNGDGNPTAIEFSDIQETRPDEFIFQLVGANIYNETLDFDNRKSPLNAAQTFEGHAWADAWLQYDDEGNVYYDANGKYVYQTVYQASWFKAHPTYFYRASDDLQYRSGSITFVNVESMTPEALQNDPYAQFYQSRNVIKQFGGHLEGDDKYSWSDGENTYAYYEDMKTDTTGEDVSGSRTTTNDWQCYVVKDMWIKGDFKVWSGFGGGCVAYEFDMDGSRDKTRNDARWNVENGGGSSQEYRKYTVQGFDVTTNQPVTVYAAYRDVVAADFRVGDGETLTFFNRMILWYNPNDGIENAVLQLITEISSPQIIAKNHKDGETVSQSAIDYEWTISDYANINHDRKVTKYVVKRYRVTKEGASYTGVVEEVDLTDQTVASFFDANKDGKADMKTFTDTGLTPGTYQYEVILYFEDEDDEVTKTAMSNQITLYSTENILYPDPLAIQLLSLNDGGVDHFFASEADREHYKATATFLTYRKEDNANYYIVNPIETEGVTTGIEVIQVDSKKAAAFIASPANFKDYLWTSDFLVRAHDLTAYTSKMNQYIEKGNVMLDAVPAPVVKVIETQPQLVDGTETQVDLEEVNTYVSKIKYLDSSAKDQQFNFAIVHRAGNLDKGKFTARLKYQFENTVEGENDEQRAAHFRNTDGAVQFQPVAPKPYGGTYKYAYNTKRGEIGTLVTTDYIRLHVKSSAALDIDNGEFFDEEADTRDILIKTADVKPRQLDCEMGFMRPNVSDEVVHYYDIYYKVKLTKYYDSNSSSVEDIDKNMELTGTYYDEAQIDYDDPENPVRPADNYHFTVRNVHPSRGVYPVFEIVETEYRHNTTAAEIDGYLKPLKATFGEKMNIIATQNTQRTGFDDPEVRLICIKNGDDADANYDWRYYGHTAFEDNGDIVVKDPKNVSDDDLVISDPAFYHIEVIVSGSDYASYDYAWQHPTGHQSNGWTAETNENGMIINDDADKLIGTTIAKGFSSPSTPQVIFTPVYVFFRDPEIVPGEDTPVTTELKAENKSDAPARRAAKKAAQQAPAADRMPDHGSSVYETSVTDINDIDNLVAVQGGPSKSNVSSGDKVLTGIEDVSYDNLDGTEMYFDMQGRRLPSATNGVYIRVSARGAEKVYIK